MFNGSIVSFFSLLVKKTGRKLTKLFMIDYAITADPFSWTGFICAVTVFQIPFFVAFHIIFLPNKSVFDSFSCLYAPGESMLYLPHLRYRIRYIQKFPGSISSGQYNTEFFRFIFYKIDCVFDLYESITHKVDDLIQNNHVILAACDLL